MDERCIGLYVKRYMSDVEDNYEYMGVVLSKSMYEQCVGTSIPRNLDYEESEQKVKRAAKPNLV